MEMERRRRLSHEVTFSCYFMASLIADHAKFQFGRNLAIDLA